MEAPEKEEKEEQQEQETENAVKKPDLSYSTEVSTVVSASTSTSTSTATGTSPPPPRKRTASIGVQVDLITEGVGIQVKYIPYLCKKVFFHHKVVSLRSTSLCLIHLLGR